MVRHMGNVPFLDGMSYAEVHRIAKAETLEDVEPGLCLVGVLRHDKELDGKSFLWFKTRRVSITPMYSIELVKFQALNSAIDV